ncbi:MAG: hypothetical protein V5A44_10995 [Haloarculaceae archaeon]
MEIRPLVDEVVEEVRCLLGGRRPVVGRREQERRHPPAVDAVRPSDFDQRAVVGEERVVCAGRQQRDGRVRHRDALQLCDPLGVRGRFTDRRPVEKRIERRAAGLALDQHLAPSVFRRPHLVGPVGDQFQTADPRQWDQHRGVDDHHQNRSRSRFR